MTALAPTLQAFFTDRLARQRHASPHTIAAYRDTWRLLLGFAASRTGKQPSQLDIADLDAPLIGAFLDHLEHDRGNSPRTRNARLAAIHSLFRYAALRHPEHAEAIARVLAIPPKRYDKALVTYLTEPETRGAARRPGPDHLDRTARPRHAPARRPDRAAGLRADRAAPPATSTSAPGRTSPAPARAASSGSPRSPPTTVAVLRAWLDRTRRPARPSRCSPTARGGRLSRDAVERRLAKHTATAASTCPSLNGQDDHGAHAAPHRGHAPAARRRSTPPSSRSGSATSRPKPRRSTCTPTSRSKNKPSPGPPHPTPSPAATGPPTPCSPSSKPSDYADLPAAHKAATSGSRRQVGIIPRSA